MIAPHQINRLAWAFVSVAATVFVVRGPMRAVSGGGDFAAPYAATIAWVHGENPYDGRVLTSILRNAGRERDDAGRPAFTPSVYPPSTFLLLAPLSWLSWKSARIVWLATLLVLFVLHLRALLRLCDLRPRDTKGLLLIGGVLALAPYHTGIALGQLAVASVELLVIAIGRVKSDSNASGALALALAVTAKPQIAAPFLIYFFLRSRRMAALMAVGGSTSLAIVAVGWLWWHRVSWFATWRANTHAELNGGAMDPGGPLSVQMIDLRPLLVSLIGVQNAGAIGIALVASAAAVLYWRGRDTQDELLLLSAVGVLTLLIAYHRFYDAALLCLPLAWAISRGWRDVSTRWHAIGVSACGGVFVVPGAVMLDSISRSHVFFWDAIILRHEIWALVAMLVLLFLAIHRASPTRWDSSRRYASG